MSNCAVMNTVWKLTMYAVYGTVTTAYSLPPFRAPLSSFCPITMLFGSVSFSKSSQKDLASTESWASLFEMSEDDGKCGS